MNSFTSLLHTLNQLLNYHNFLLGPRDIESSYTSVYHFFSKNMIVYLLLLNRARDND